MKIPSGFVLKPEGDFACCSMRGGPRKCRSLAFYMAPMHDVAPRAVTIAVAILAIICTMNFNVSFFVIMVNL